MAYSIWPDRDSRGLFFERLEAKDFCLALGGSNLEFL